MPNKKNFCVKGLIYDTQTFNVFFSSYSKCDSRFWSKIIFCGTQKSTCFGWLTKSEQKWKQMSRFFLKKKMKKADFFWKYVVLGSKTTYFPKIQLFSPFFFRKKHDIVFRFCLDFENHPKHMLFWLTQKIIFDQNLESHLLYEAKNMWKV